MGTNMKIDRLMGIVIYLLNHGRTSAQKLAEEFEVSSRTIMRDLESLDQAGIPIQSFHGMEGGYQIMDGYVMEKQAATEQEYAWIVTALKGMVSAYTNKHLERTLSKLKSISNPESIPIVLDLGSASEDPQVNAHLRLLEDAILQKRIVQFSYTNSHGERKELQAEPVRLQYQWYNWYLIGYYEKYHDYCMFKLVRMEHVKTTDRPNAKIHDPASIKLTNNTGNGIHIVLQGKAAIKSKCREYLNGQITKEYENGDFEFCFSAPEHETFWYGVLLSFGNQVRIIEPQQIKERILQTCKEIQQVYGKEG